MKLKYIKTITLLLITYIFSFNVYSQERNIKFKNISLENGLSQSSVYTILQDSKGFIWFGTLDGLNKYDGYKITRYRHNPKDPFSISDNSINVIYEDKDENLWIGTRSSGLCKYDKISDRFYNFKHDPNNKNSISNNNITSIIETSHGILWIGTEAGLNKFDTYKKTFQLYNNKVDINNNVTLSNNIIHCITADKAGDLWIATEKGLNKFTVLDEKLIQSKNIVGLSNKILRNSRINTIYIDSHQNIWVGTDKGLTKWNIEENSFKQYIKSDSDCSISDNVITSIIEDHEQILCVGTKNGGLNRFNPETGCFQNYMYDAATRNSISSNHILTIYLDKTNILWIGTYLGGVNKWNRSADELITYHHNPYHKNSLSSNNVRSIYQDNSNDIWIGTVDKGLNKLMKSDNTFIHFRPENGNDNSLSHNHIRCMFEDSKGRFWIGTDEGGLNLFNRKTQKFISYTHIKQDSTSISDNHVWKIFEDSQGVLWIGTHGGGLNIFNPETEIFTAFSHSQSSLNSLSNNYITTILEDHENNLWIGTMGGGINKLITKIKDINNIPKTLQFKSYQFDANDNTSLGNNRVYSIIEDRNNILWIGTKGNLNKFDKENEAFIKYSEEDGFPNDVIMGILEDNNNNLWISTNGGLSRFNKETLKVKNYGVNDGLQSNEFLVGSFCKAKDGALYFGGINGFNVFYPSKLKENPNVPPIVVTGFQIRNHEVNLDTSITEINQINLTYKDDVISFDFVALDYTAPEKNQYSYMMVGFDDDWINFGTKRYASFTNLYPGEYTFRVKGSNNDGVWNEKGATIKIIVSPPFWRTIWFYILVGLIVISIIIFYISFRERKLRNDKSRLEEQVTERTLKTEKQKEDIIRKNIVLEQQKHEIEKQKDKIEHTYLNVKMLSEVGTKITSHLLIEEILETVYDDLRKIIDAQIYAVGIFDDQTNRLVFAGAKANGRTIPYFFHDIKEKNHLSVYCFDTQSDFLIKDCKQQCSDYTEKILPLPIKEAMNSLIYVPLIVKDKTLGVVTVQNNKTNAYSELHLNLLKNFAVYVAIALDNAEAYKKIEKQNKEITIQRDKIKLRNVELKDAYRKIKESAKLKQIFLANMSHEIRTPLNAINGYSNLLLNSDLGDKQYQYTANIKISSEHLSFIINDILDLSKIEAGKLEIEHTDFDFKDSMSNFFSSIIIKANEKNISLQSTIGERVPPYLNGDPYRLNQILTNLVGNAIKFTSSGGKIHLTVLVIDEQSDNVTLLFKVSDNGIGIHKTKLELIFDNFTQSSPDTTRKFGGTGLGLSIVKQLIELQGGSVDVKSELNVGTEFSFSLNFKIADGAFVKRKGATYKISSVANLTGTNILLVEDNPVNQEIAVDTILLYNKEIKIDCAENGRIAIEKILKKDYDIIIMDIQMPEMDGIDATKYIRNKLLAPKNKVPILGMSAHAMKTERERCLNIGMNDYITKPFEPGNLFSKIEACIRVKKEMNIEIIEKEIILPVEKKYIYIDLAYLPKTYNKSPERRKKILNMCLVNIPKDISNLQSNFNKENWKGVKDIAHSLKTLMFYLGLINLREKLEKIENNAKFEKNISEINLFIKEIVATWEKANLELEKIVKNII